MIKLFTFFFILSCASSFELNEKNSNHFSSLKISFETKEQYLKLESAISWFSALEKRYNLEFPKELKPLAGNYHEIFKKIKLVEISQNSCAHGIFACVYPDRKGQVYIKPVVLAFPKEQIISTLLHEQVHHLTNYNHTRCRKVERWQHECDDTQMSAYGVELNFFQALRKASNRPNQELIDHFKQRINFL